MLVIAFLSTVILALLPSRLWWAIGCSVVFLLHAVAWNGMQFANGPSAVFGIAVFMIAGSLPHLTACITTGLALVVEANEGPAWLSTALRSIGPLIVLIIGIAWV